MLNILNSVHTALKFTIGKEIPINFVDLTIHKETPVLIYKIYIEPTQIDMTITIRSKDSNLHKTVATFRSLLYRA